MNKRRMMGRAGRPLLFLSGLLATLGFAGAAAQAQQYTAIGDSLTVGITDTSPVTIAPNGGVADRVDAYLDANRGTWNTTNLAQTGARVTDYVAPVTNGTGPDVLNEQLPNVAATNPDLVTLTVGANDATAIALAAVADLPNANAIQASGVAQFDAAYDMVLATLRGLSSNPRIILTNIPNLSLLPAADDNPDTPAAGDGYAPDALRKNLLTGLINQLNATITANAAQYNVPVIDLFNDANTYAPANISAGDGFHPSEAGYVNLASKFTAILASPLVVTTTADTGAGSLRQAITDANNFPGPDVIQFNIPAGQAGGGGVFTISPATTLPPITDPVTIDGYSQGTISTPADNTDDATVNTNPLAAGLNTKLLIQLSGGALAGSGLQINAGGDGSTIRGLAINGFLLGNGIFINGANNVSVTGNYLGTNPAGTTAAPNLYGIQVANATNTNIGGTAVGLSNLISGNVTAGVYVNSAPGTVAQPNQIQRNLIGTNAAGNAALANGTLNSSGETQTNNGGVIILNSASTLVGTNGNGNVVSANNGVGVLISRNAAAGNDANVVQGNIIGGNAANNAGLGNRSDNVEIVGSSGNVIGGATAGEDNYIRSSLANGVAIIAGAIVVGPPANNNLIIGNTITANTTNGILITAGTGNRISINRIFANTALGISLTGTGVPAVNDPGDADTTPGGNNLQNYPMITSVTTAGGNTTITGTLDSAAGATYTLQFFTNTAADATTFGEGETFFSNLVNVVPNTTFTRVVPALPAGTLISVTATNDTTGDTSEFSRVVAEGTIVNQPPVNSVPAAQTINEDTSQVFSTGNSNAISISDPDAGANPVRVTLTVNNGTLTLSGVAGLTFNTGDGTADSTIIFTGTVTDINTALNGLTYAPNANYNGPDTLTITTNDQGNTGIPPLPQQDTDTVGITVTAVNDAPSFTVGANQVVAEDAGAQTVANFATAISAGPANENAQTVTFNVTNNNNALFTVQPSIAPNGTLTYTPAPNANGVATVTVTLSDNGGTGNGGVDTSAPQTFTITVSAVNDAPVAQNQNVGTPEDTPLNITLTASDVDNVALTYSIVAAPQHGTLSGSGATRTYTPAANYNGSDAFTFKANDGAADSNIATITITIGGVNDAPVAVNDTAATDKNVPVDINVLTNDTDADGDTLRVARVATTMATRGTVVINPNGTLRYSPERNFSGTATFTYTVTDGTLESTATVTVTVRPTNASPDANDDTYAVNAGPLTVAAPGVLGNDTDADGDTLTVTIVTQPTNGTVTLNADGSFTYTPASTFNGTDTFTYKASDGTATDTATVTLTVTSNNPPPAPKLTLTIAPSTFNENAGPTAAVATLTRNGDTTEPLLVALGSSDTSEAQVPRSIEIPSGATSVSFFIAALDDKVIDGNHNVNILAIANNFPRASANVRVLDNGIVRIPLTLTINPRGFLESAGQRAAIGTVSIPTPAKVDYAITLSSSDESEARVAQTVTIRAGRTSATFFVSAVDDSEADSVQPVTITARRQGFGTAIETIKVGDDDTSALLLTIDSDNVSEGGEVRATVTRNRSLPLALTVLLSSSAPGAAQVQPAVTIPAGEFSASFLVRGVRDRVAGNTRSAIITASRPGATSDSATISVVDRGNNSVANSKVRLSAAAASAATGTLALVFTGALDSAAIAADNFTVAVNGEAVAVEAINYDATTSTVKLVLADGALNSGGRVSVEWDRLLDENGAVIEGAAKVAVK